MISFIIFLFYLLFSFFPFGKLPSTFFLQDEWVIFGNYLYWDKESLSWFERLFIFEQYTHLIPLSNLVSYLQFKFFGLNFAPYGIFSIALHILNAYLVYYLTTLIIKNRWVSFLGGLLFLTNSISHQAVTWVATTSGTAGSLLFALLSIIFFTKYILIKNKIIFLLLSVVFLFTSLLFKETSIFLFFVFPTIWFIFTKKKSIKKFIVFSIPFFITGIFYLLIRLFFLVIGETEVASQDDLSQPSFVVFIFRAITIPFKFLAQSFVPSEYIINFSETLVTLSYPQFMEGGAPNPYIVQSVGVDIVSFAVAISIILVCIFALYIYRKKNKELWAKFILLALIFIVLSSLPFIIIPGPAGYFSLVDGRHLYLTNTFTSVLLAILLSSFYFWISKKIFGLTILLTILVGIIGLHSLRVRNDINYQVGTGIIRTSILSEISKKYPELPKRSVFYVESDKAYYGLAENEKILPFQSGFGQTLLVWYNNKGENFPACFFRDQFLYVLLSEGYRECDGRGFGYFRKLETLKTSLLENNLSVENIIAIKYNSSTHQLTDISEKVVSTLKQ